MRTPQSNEREHIFRLFMHGKIEDSAIDRLIDMGFVDAPASTRHHGAYEGGLFDHSLCVALELNKLTKDNGLIWAHERSPMLVGMLHDLCKVDQYRKLDVPDGDKQYEYVETQVHGHGEKSVIYLRELIDITDEEEACIRYHMGAFTNADEWSNYTNALRQFNNVLWTHQADMIAAHIVGT